LEYLGERDKRLDLLKGIAIVLVVLGHVIQNNVSNFDDNLLFKIIYSFHMPLFMFISGILSSNTRKFNLQFIDKKFRTLVVPFVLWYILYYVIKGTYKEISIFEYIKMLIYSPDNGLWFLWILFLNYCALTLVVYLQSFNRYIPPILIIFILLLMPLKFNVLGLKLLGWHFVFFIFGYFISINKELFNKYNNFLFKISIIVYPLLLLYWHRTSGPIFLQNIELHPIFKEIVSLAYNYITAFSAIILMLNIVRKLSLNKLKWLGTKTIEIYSLHFIFLFGIGTGIIRIITEFAIALVCSITVSQIISQSKLLRKLLFGR
jgi:fucose 4-O-acetylase-like acetyltransferase